LFGSCKEGKYCRFSHDPLSGPVKVFGGEEEQLKDDDVPSTHLVRDEYSKYRNFDIPRLPCKYFHLNNSCFNGSNCKFSHDALKSPDQLDYLKRINK